MCESIEGDLLKEDDCVGASRLSSVSIQSSKEGGGSYSL